MKMFKSKKNQNLDISFLNKGDINYKQFNSIRTSLNFLNTDKRYKKKYSNLSITSSIDGEGKSFISINLALSFARQKKRVLLVDSDLKKFTLSKKFKLSTVKGLSDYLINNALNIDNEVHETKFKNLFLLSAGTKAKDAFELLGFKNITTLVDDLSKNFDIVIYDTPSILSVSNARIIPAIVPSILVIRANYVQKNQTKQSIGLLNEVHSNLIGTIFNDF